LMPEDFAKVMDLLKLRPMQLARKRPADTTLDFC